MFFARCWRGFFGTRVAFPFWWRMFTWRVWRVRRIHARHSTRRAILRHTIRRRIVATVGVAIGHHCVHVVGAWRGHGIAVTSSSGVAIKIAVGSSAASVG
jgi:hypothetical protein